MKNFKIGIYLGMLLVGLFFISPAKVKAAQFSCDCRAGFSKAGGSLNGACDQFDAADQKAASSMCSKMGCEAYPGVCKGLNDRCVCTDEKTGKAKCFVAKSTDVEGKKAECAKGYPGYNACVYEEGTCDLEVEAKSQTPLYGLKSEARKILNPVGFATGKKGVLSLMGRFINFLMFPIGAFAMLMYVYAGFLWMSSSPDNISKAKSILVWTTLGVIASLSSYIIVKFVFSSLFE